jgi:quercetin dioxygenase-like cupin family protein
VDISPEAPPFEHKHPGEEIIYVLEGSLEYRLEGEPPTTLEAGEVFFVPAETVHAVKNVGTANAVELATYVVEKGKPLIVLIK